MPRSGSHRGNVWEPRETQIFAADVFLLFVGAFEAASSGQDTIRFIDSEAAASAAIRGSSDPVDI